MHHGASGNLRKIVILVALALRPRPAPPTTSHAHRRVHTPLVRFSAGYPYGLLQMPAKFRLRPLMMKESGQTNDERELVVWLKKTRPNAILTNVSLLPKMLAEAGYQVPRDLGLAASSVLDDGASAGIYQNSQESGAAAVQLPISLLHHNQRGIPQIPREVLIPGH